MARPPSAFATLGARARAMMGRAPSRPSPALRGMTRRRRSALYLPASNAKAIAKARTLACDVVILDLEDAVAPESKAIARAQAVQAVREGFGHREVVVRVNALSTPEGEEDLRALSALAPGGILVPKVNSAEDLAPYANAAPIWAMIETARGVLHLDAIASASGVAALVLGTNDLVKETGMRPSADRLPLHGAMAQTVFAARAYGLAAFDGVYNAIDDVVGLAEECAQAARFGFDGKTLIHPSQIDPCHLAFRSAPEDVRWAERIIRAFEEPEAAGKGAIRVDGRMVERLHLDEARRTVEIAVSLDPTIQK